MNNGASLAQTRAIVFTTLILSNVFLTFTNRSFVSTIYYTIRYKNKLAPIVLIVSAIFMATMYDIPAVRPVSIRDYYSGAILALLWDSICQRYVD
jgi:Ca2+-transporting ATPase